MVFKSPGQLLTLNSTYTHSKPHKLKMNSFHSVPSLKLRKDIWTHFPVCLVKLTNSEDGMDRYSVQWHQKHLQEWSQGIHLYSTVTKARLLKALSMASDRWTLGPPAHSEDLCTITMKVSDKSSREKTDQVLPDFLNSNPVVTSIESMKQYLPICWKLQKARYSIEYHNTELRSLSEMHGIPESELKIQILQKCIQWAEQNRWKMLPSTKASEVCQLHLPA